MRTTPRLAKRAQQGRDPQRGTLWLYGLHAVSAALRNSQRKCRRCLVTARAMDQVGHGLLSGTAHEIVAAEQISRVLPPGAVHQGVALDCDPLPRLEIDDILRLPGRRIVMVLDQISDPHNVGAILRSAAAFDAAAVMVQDRHAPPESGALAKAASGALDLVAYLTVVNVARALRELGDAGFWRVALAGDAGRPLSEGMAAGDLALVLGSEGEGIRHLVRSVCDDAVSITIGGRMESLNVSNAAAIALYECRRAEIKAVADVVSGR